VDSYIDIPEPKTLADAVSRAALMHFIDAAPELCPELMSFVPLMRWMQADESTSPTFRVSAETGETIEDESGSPVCGSFDLTFTLSVPIGDESAALDFEAARAFLARRLDSPEFRAALAAAFPCGQVWTFRGPEDAEADGPRFVATFSGELWLSSFDWPPAA
jgi:uncharacterized protein (DUF736 family)